MLIEHMCLMLLERIRCGRVVRKGEIRTACKNVIGEPEGKRLGSSGVYDRAVLKLMLKTPILKAWRLEACNSG
jgi:hypothetical protein